MVGHNHTPPLFNLNIHDVEPSPLPGPLAPLLNNIKEQAVTQVNIKSLQDCANATLSRIPEIPEGSVDLEKALKQISEMYGRSQLHTTLCHTNVEMKFEADETTRRHRECYLSGSWSWTRNNAKC